MQLLKQDTEDVLKSQFSERNGLLFEQKKERVPIFWELNMNSVGKFYQRPVRTTFDSFYSSTSLL